jgi:6-phosphogluconate dehydrogenase
MPAVYPAALWITPSFRRTYPDFHHGLLAMASSLAYYDAYRSERLPANLTQAQRDYFGAHTYRRTDKDGIFHTEWTPTE